MYLPMSLPPPPLLAGNMSKALSLAARERMNPGRRCMRDGACANVTFLRVLDGGVVWIN